MRAAAASRMRNAPATARRVGWRAALAACGALPASAMAACIAFAAYPDGAPLAEFATAPSDPAFVVTYVHSVTRTPVYERYRIDGDTVVQTEIRFAQHGPGLPTQPDAGESFVQRDGQFVMTLARRFHEIVMRVHRDQSPRLLVGTYEADLAAWGNRALVLRVNDGPCHAS